MISLTRSSHRAEDTIWALRDVSFEVEQGEVLGIIGGNGAGKSTLLKILSRITDPTEGRAVLHGRVASLLEVGTGFHPELTGRENIYLSGAVLGMRRAEINAKFDQIVDFSGVEKFLDTPVKRYSSGMRVRLGFAVAAHLEPEILLIDEVLAVGDAQFQKKCVAKMESVADSGRTVLFVSHNMSAVSSLCSRAIQLREGQVALRGDPREVVDSYLSAAGEVQIESDPEQEHLGVRIESVQCCNSKSEVLRTVTMGSELHILVACNCASSNPFGLQIAFLDASGQRVFRAYSGREGVVIPPGPGKRLVRFVVPCLPLNAGDYRVLVDAWEEPDWHLIHRAIPCPSFRVLTTDMAGAGYVVRPDDGVVWINHDWEVS